MRYLEQVEQLTTLHRVQVRIPCQEFSAALLLYYHEVQVNWGNVRVKCVVFSQHRVGDTVPDKNMIKTEVSHTPRRYTLFLDVIHQIPISKMGIPRRNARRAKKTDRIVA